MTRLTSGPLLLKACRQRCVPANILNHLQIPQFRLVVQIRLPVLDAPGYFLFEVPCGLPPFRATLKCPECLVVALRSHACSIIKGAGSACARQHACPSSILHNNKGQGERSRSAPRPQARRAAGAQAESFKRIGGKAHMRSDPPGHTSMYARTSEETGQDLQGGA